MDIIPKKSVHHCWKPENLKKKRCWKPWFQRLPTNRAALLLRPQSQEHAFLGNKEDVIEAIAFSTTSPSISTNASFKSFKQILPFGLKKGSCLLLVAPIPFSQGSCKEVVNTSNSSESPESSSFCCGRGVNICRVISKCLAQVVDLWLQLMRTQNSPHKYIM